MTTPDERATGGWEERHVICMAQSGNDGGQTDKFHSDITLCATPSLGPALHLELKERVIMSTGGAPQEIRIFVNGLRIPGFFNPQYVKEAIAYEPNAGDVFVASFPKCGTTWLQYIVWCAFNLDKIDAGKRLPTMDEIMCTQVPLLEWIGTDRLDDLPAPRLMKTHLPFSTAPVSPRAKYVVIVRNPFDCAVSLFYHRKNHAERVGLTPDYGFDAFLEDFLAGELPYGSYFDHVMSWYRHRQDHNVRLLSYEELRRDAPGEILKIADFLDPSGAGHRLRSDPGLLVKVIEATSFQNLKANAFRKDSKDTSDQPKGHNDGRFFRKGVVGDWRNHFSPDQEERLRKLYQKRMAGTDLCAIWKNCIS